MTVPPPTVADVAASLFGSNLGLAARYADSLSVVGVQRGLIGPHEAARIWERHLINSALIGELVDADADVVDVGSGAGLPGIPLALSRSDVSVTLVEPMERRTRYLREVVHELGIANVQIVRARAEDCWPDRAGALDRLADVVTARAVASLDRLARYCLPLLRVGGQLLAIKGDNAADEIVRTTQGVVANGGTAPVLHQCGRTDMRTWVVVVGKAEVTPRRGGPGSAVFPRQHPRSARRSYGRRLG